MNSHTTQDHHHQSETVKRFKVRFENQMKKCKAKADNQVANAGAVNWRDVGGGAGISAASLAGTAVVAVLAGASTALTAGATLGVGVAAVVAAAIFSVVRAKKKMLKYQRTSDLLQRDDFDEKLSSMADKLCSLYRFQLNNCSPKDAELLAEACFKSLKHEIKTNSHLKFHELLLPSHLQALIVKSAKQVTKQSLSINGREDEKANTRGAITHTGIYCEESGQFYRAESSKPTKYGVLFFEKRQDLENYKLLIEKVKRDKSTWEFEKMPPAQVKLLKRNDLFKLQDSEEDYQSIDDDSSSHECEHNRGLGA